MMVFGDDVQDPGFYDSICMYKKCGHKMARDCFRIKCNCCKLPEHSLAMDGIEGFGVDNKVTE